MKGFLKNMVKGKSNKNSQQEDLLGDAFYEKRIRLDT
jgi:hypothetical protein